MSWTINDATPESLGVTLASVTLNQLTPSEMRLDRITQELDSSMPSGLDFNDTVTLKYDGNQVFKGKVRSTPRFGDASSEGQELIVLDSFDQLERIIFHETRAYATSVAYTDDFSSVTYTNYDVGSVIFEKEKNIGERIRDVITYAIAQGADLSIGTIPDGIEWFRTEHHDQTCADIIRDLIRLMPEYVLWLDHSTSTPTVNMTLRTSGTSKVLDLDSGNEIESISYTQLSDQVVKGVVIKYEIPVSLEGQNYTFLQIDTAGNTEGEDVVVETVSINSWTFQNEYAHVVTSTIPDGDNATTVLEWWVKRTPELAGISRKLSEGSLATIMAIDSENPHTLNVEELGETRPAPINPNSKPVGIRNDPDSADPEDYPRELIEGSIPYWSGKRTCTMSATCTVKIDKSDVDALAEADQLAIKSIFGKLEYGYYIGELNAMFTATNASTKNYMRSMTADLDELPPSDIAQQLYDQYKETRYEGNLNLRSAECDTSINLDYRIKIGSIDEPIQSLQFDINTGVTSIQFGPPTLLGANDLMDRLRATKINRHSHNLRSGKTIEEGTGGTVATPRQDFTITSNGGGGEDQPWHVTLALDGSDSEATVRDDSYLYESDTSRDKISVVNGSSSITVVAGDYLVLEYDASGDTWTLKAIDPDTVDLIERDVAGELDYARVPIASFVDDGGTVVVDEQFVNSHLAVTGICESGKIATWAYPV